VAAQLPEDVENGPSISVDTFNGEKLFLAPDATAPGQLKLHSPSGSIATTVQSDVRSCNAVLDVIDHVLLP
jgi:hypothetical protein